MLIKMFGSAVFGVEATTITVEVNIDKGVGYHLVGLPDNAIKESSYRIAAALKNNGYNLPVKKITINMGYIDLGHIDLMVREGFYSNRTDFIRTAIRNQLERHSDIAQKAVQRHEVDLGLRHYSRADLEALRAAGHVIHINVLGLVSIAVELALATIASVTVLGGMQASPAVKAALASRMK